MLAKDELALGLACDLVDDALRDERALRQQEHRLSLSIGVGFQSPGDILGAMPKMNWPCR